MRGRSAARRASPEVLPRIMPHRAARAAARLGRKLGIVASVHRDDVDAACRGSPRGPPSTGSRRRASAPSAVSRTPPARRRQLVAVVVGEAGGAERHPSRLMRSRRHGSRSAEARPRPTGCTAVLCAISGGPRRGARPAPIGRSAQLPSGETTVPDPGALHRREHRVRTPPVVLIAEELAPVRARRARRRRSRSATSTAPTGPRCSPALADADAVLVRSATKIDAEALAAAARLKVVARAGVGLDNVDVPAATARGVMVVNAPTSNIVSAAEHAIALLLAVGPAHPGRRRGAAGGASGSAVQVHRRRAGRQDRRRRRPRPDRRSWSPQRLAAFGVRLHRLRPVRRSRPAPRSSASSWSAWTSCSREPTSSPIHLPKTPGDARPDRQGRSWR